MEAKVISELAQYFNILDLVAVFAVYFIVQQLKEATPKVLRPWLVFVIGFAVAVSFGASFGRELLFFGIIYSASAIALRKTKIVDKLIEVVKRKIGSYDG